jgi:hypothetical protein
MNDDTARSSPDSQRRKSAGIVLLALAAAIAVVGVRHYYTFGVDWQATFYPASQNWRDPYVIPTFTNPPWILVLLPHALLGQEWGGAINLVLNVAVTGAIIWRYKGGWQALLLTFTSPVFFDLARTNNVDWIPALAFLVPAMWGLPLLAVKPQALGGAALVWWKRRGFSPLVFVPVVVVIGLSLVVWGFWPERVGLVSSARYWNFAPFPIGIPLGVYLLWRAYQAEDEILAAAATPFLMPYFAPYSLAPLLALVACRYRREAFYAYAGFWMFFVVENRRLGLFLAP